MAGVWILRRKPSPSSTCGKPTAKDCIIMSRQDANTVFAHTSFLYGGNAAYIEDLYAKYETDPASVDAEWADFF